MRKSVKRFCRSCGPCQRSKISRHVKAPLQSFPPPGERFSSINLDLVGPLPPADGYTYLLTIMDRFSRWPEAIPLTEITAPACARALVRHWVSRFGVPLQVTTDQGRQFTSVLWKHLMELLGTSHSLTTAYHPQSNGLIERFHRTLKERLMARAQAAGSGTWMDHLPFVMLGLRAAVREDADCSPADLVYGSSLRLPADLLESTTTARVSPSAFVDDLRDVMRQSSPMPFLYHGNTSSSVPAALSTCPQVFIRVDAVRPPLRPPYEGPFPVLQRGPKTFTVRRNSKDYVVSIDRLKPASMEFSAPLQAGSPPSVPASAASSATAQTTAVVSPAAASPLDPRDWPLPTRYGRRPRPVERFGT